MSAADDEREIWAVDEPKTLSLAWAFKALFKFWKWLRG